MEFHEYRSFHDICKSLTDCTWQEFYASEGQRLFAQAFQENALGRDNTQSVIGNVQMQAEQAWYQDGRPYYKIYPNLLPYFLTTKLQVPCEYFRLPFASILIRLPKEHSVDSLRIDENHYVKSILVSSFDVEPDNPPVMFHPQGGVISYHSCRQVVVWVDLNECESTLRVPIYTYQQLLFDNFKETAEQALEQCKQRTRRRLTPDGEFLDDGGILVPYHVVDACWRIVIAVSFLSTGGDKIVEFDVLNRDLAKYLQAVSKQDEPRQQQLVDRAKRNGKNGYTIGRELPFPAIIRHSSSSGESETSGRELQFQHQRSAHWHWVPYGPGRAMMKLVFYKQLTVRPDLPPKSSADRGYRTPT